MTHIVSIPPVAFSIIPKFKFTATPGSFLRDYCC